MDNYKIRQNPGYWISSYLLKEVPKFWLSYVLKVFWSFEVFLSKTIVSDDSFPVHFLKQDLIIRGPGSRGAFRPYKCKVLKPAAVVEGGHWVWRDGESGLWLLRFQCGMSTCIKTLLLRWGEIPTCGSTIKYVTLFHEMSSFSHIIRSYGLCYHEVTIFCPLFGKISSPFSLMTSKELSIETTTFEFPKFNY